MSAEHFALYVDAHASGAAEVLTQLVRKSTVELDEAAQWESDAAGLMAI